MASDKSNVFYSKVRELIHLEWDPIGVSDFVDEFGEYDSYIPNLFKLLESRSSNQEVFDFLWVAETEAMGLSGDQERTKQFTEKLCKLADEYSCPTNK